MNMFARFDENPALTFQDIKKTKRYGLTNAWTDGRTHVKTVITTNKVCGGYNYDIYLSERNCVKEIVLYTCKPPLGAHLIQWDTEAVPYQLIC